MRASTGIGLLVLSCILLFPTRGLANMPMTNHAREMLRIDGSGPSSARIYSREDIKELELRIKETVRAVRIKRAGKVSSLFYVGAANEPNRSQTITLTGRVIDAEKLFTRGGFILVGRPNVDIRKIFAKWEKGHLSSSELARHLLWFGSIGITGTFSLYDVPLKARIHAVALVPGHVSSPFSIKLNADDSGRVALFPVKVSKSVD